MWNCCYSFKCFLCRYAVVALVSVVPLLAMGGKAHNVVVVDSITRMPLSGAYGHENETSIVLLHNVLM